MRVTYSKLVKYAEENRYYQLLRKGSKVQILFTPTFPEAESHGEGENIRVCMYGNLQGDQLIIDRVEVDVDGRVSPKSSEDAEYIYSPWLRFIEENY
ncbi:MAG: hypothetical protein M1357_01000 [Candidatus Marsarchaeota archaeon]|nr:hypothetical protein [Candidatus Marsarchaeota archaeon]